MREISATAREPVIVAAVRSPIGRASTGSLTGIRPDDLAAAVVREAIAKVPELDPSDVDDLLLGSGLPGGEQDLNMARSVAVLLGHDRLPGMTVARFCASSLQTTRMACHAIAAGEGEAFVSAGVEIVSRYRGGMEVSPPDVRNPAYAAARRRAEEHDSEWRDPRLVGELPDPYVAMGLTAENVAELCGVSRQAQDEFALRSHQLATKAAEDGFWAREIMPVTLPEGTVASADDGPRAGTTFDKLFSLAPAFRDDGTVTAGNSCPLNDGAAALVVVSRRQAAELGLTPLARVVSTAVTALSPEIMGLGPVEATRTALARAGMSVDDVDLAEINEAFAAQVVACQRQLHVPDDRLNVNGGAIAIGHPFGMTGARLTATLLNGLSFHDKAVGLEAMCVGGGQGLALVLERLS